LAERKRHYSKFIFGAPATAFVVLPVYAAALTISNSPGIVTSTPGATNFANFDGTAITSIGTVRAARWTAVPIPAAAVRRSP
jgi:hypothetical protein